MNPCAEPNSEILLNRYVQGSLSEVDARRFEEHLFECPFCVAQVEALQTVARKLAADPVALPERAPVKKEPIVWPYRTMGSIAAVLVVMCLVFLLVRRAHRLAPTTAATTAHDPLTAAKPDSALVALADLSMPPYQPAHLRGAGGNADFATGMQAYSQRDCQAALTSLARVPSDDSAGLAARFYTGVCEMQQHDLAAAYGSLSQVAYSADSPQQEAAFYYIAQVEMARGDAISAQADLVQTLILHGDFERRAHIELNKIRTQPKPPNPAENQ